TVIIAYTPNCLGKLDQCDLEMLHDHGFPVPLSQLPEYHGCGGGLEGSPQVAAVTTEDSQAKECNKDSDWSLYLDLEPGTVKIADAVEDDFGGPRLQKVEVSYTRNIEQILAGLTSPLDVTRTVHPDEVFACLEQWRPAILKEVAGIEGAIEKLHPGSAPMLRGSFRDDTLQELKTPRGLKWKQGKAVTSWWSVLDTSGAVAAIVVVYVDDFMICGPREIVTELGTAVKDVWETSELTFLGPGSSVRFLGMELQRESEDSEEILVGQHGYIQELLRLHGVTTTSQDRIPITKELAVVPSTPEEED
ncbi:unnamed protein product, partial [Symbiodinium necroappetens]